MPKIFINKQSRTLHSDRACRNPLSLQSLLPVAGASLPLELYAFDAAGPSTLTSPVVTISSPTTPLGGVVRLSYDGDSLGEVEVNGSLASLQAYLNQHSGIAAIGGVDVMQDGGTIIIAAREAGTTDTLSVASSDLLPFGSATLTEVQAGSSTERAVWHLQLQLGTIAIIDSWTQTAAVTGTVSTLVEGSASVCEVQRIVLAGEPVKGYWTITTASGSTAPLRHDAGCKQVEGAINAKLGTGTVVVSSPAPFVFDIAWQAVASVSALTVTTSGLTALQKTVGTLDVDTAEAAAIPSDATAIFQITEGAECIYSEQVTLVRANSAGAVSAASLPGLVRYDVAQSLSGGEQTQARTNIDAAEAGAEDTAVWGSITGNLSNQTDLSSALSGKAASSHTHVSADITDSSVTGSASKLVEWDAGSQIAPVTGDYSATFSAYGVTALGIDGQHSHINSESVLVESDDVASAGELKKNQLILTNLSGFAGTIQATNVSAARTHELPDASGSLMVGASNLSDLQSASSARSNLGLTALATTAPGTGVATFLTTPSSANLAAALTDETGTGAAVFATSPTLVTPILGTPTSGTLTNCTIPASGISSGYVSDDRLFPLRPSSFAGSYDDDFTGSSLDAKWTRQGLVSGDHTYQTGNGSWMSMSIAAGTTGAIARSIHQAWTPADSTITCRLAYQQIGSAYPMMGPFVVDSSGNGVAMTVYNNGSSIIIVTLVSWVYSASALSVTMGIPAYNIATGATGIWFKLRKSSTTYYASISYDGLFWGPEVSAVNATTMTKVGMGTFFRAGGGSDYGAKQHFDFFKIT